MRVVAVPADALSDHVIEAEAFYRTAAGLYRTEAGALDMRAVDFIRPYGVIALVMTARAFHERTGNRLVLLNLRQSVHQYLERVDLFRQMGDVLTTPSPLNERFDREQRTPNLLELTPISGTSDVLTVITQAERIFAYWLHLRNLRSLMGVLSELCANIYQHSQDPRGVVLIQTHQAVSKGQVRVRVALGDAGVGVRQSLQHRLGDIGAAPLPYLSAAMRGETSRQTGRGGLGLRLVQQTVGAGGGYLWLRSESAAVLSNGHTQTAHTGLSNVPGTQVAVDFHAPLPD